jgi:hypothetical protein
MFGEIGTAVSAENLLGGRLESVAEALLADPGLDLRDPAQALQLAMAQVLLALYWELRHQHGPGPDDTAAPGSGLVPSLEWVSALLCSSLAGDSRTPAG